MVQLNTYTRAIQVIPSAYCDIPNPSLLIVEGVTTSSGANKIICTSIDFISYGVSVGDIVYVYSDSIAATVINVEDSHTLELNTLGEAPSSGAGFFIYAGSQQNYAAKSGCVIYSIDTGSELTNVNTIGGDIIPTVSVFNTFGPLPIQVKSVEASTNSILALW